MTKYSQSYERQEVKRRPWEVHPVWRGIGCLFFLLIPVISYAAAVLLMQANSGQGWLEIPRQVSSSAVLPLLGRVFFADLIVAGVFAVIGFGIMTVVYAFVFRLVAPPRYGPLDSPTRQGPPKRR